MEWGRSVSPDTRLWTKLRRRGPLRPSGSLVWMSRVEQLLPS